MVTICASHIDRLIAYEHYDESGGGKSIYCVFQLQTTLIVTRLLQRTFKHGYTPGSSKGQTNLGIRHYQLVALKEALIYMSFDKFSCAFYTLPICW